MSIDITLDCDECGHQIDSTRGRIVCNGCLDEKIDEISGLEYKVSELEDKISELEDKISELEDELYTLR